MASSINASTTGAGGLVSTADSSGVLQLQASGATVANFTNVGGTAPRITGDFTNSTPSIAVRTMLQTSVANGASVVTVIPNGTSTNAQIQLNNNSAPENGSVLQLGASSTFAYINSNIFGTGTQLPISFQIASSEKMSIATDGTITGTKGNLQLISGTAVASTSGTSIDFTGIPSWAKRITVMFNGVSTNSTSNYQIQIGTGGTPTTSGYVSAGSQLYSGTSTTTATSGYIVYANNASFSVSGSLVLTNVSGNIWVASGTFANTVASPCTLTTGGTVTLAGVLNMVRITTVNGTDTFDAGSINIMYE